MTNDTERQAVCAVLDYLAEIIRDGVRPPEAQQRLRLVEAGQSDVNLQLVWELEAYDDSLHYDVVVRSKNGQTVSMSMCRDDVLPWPLRGIRRWTEANLVQVNGQMLTMEQAVVFLDVLWDEAWNDSYATRAAGGWDPDLRASPEARSSRPNRGLFCGSWQSVRHR